MALNTNMNALGVDQGSLHDLRTLAEEAVRKDPHPARTSEQDPLRHELRVHEMELRMQNEALRELHVEVSIARERYRELFTHAPVAYLVLDGDSTVIEANQAACALLQRDASKLSARKLSTYVELPHAERFVRHLRRVLSGTQRENVEVTLVMPDGARRDIRLESVRSPIHPQQWRSALIDLTEVRQLQRQLERSQRLEAVGTFAAGVAHDFSNLLAVVAGGADLALELSHTPDLATAPLARIKRAAGQGRNMIRQLLRFASGPESDSIGLFKLDVSVRAAETSIRQTLGSKVALRTMLDARGAEVCLDLGGPEEILLNLASNAQHAMPDGGELVIETETIMANVGLDPRLPPQSFALLTVSDTGRGMDSRTQARIFEPFFTTKSAGNGTGLGLAMVYGIVKRAGGHIQLSSELRKGTTFRIYLPLTNESELEQVE